MKKLFLLLFLLLLLSSCKNVSPIPNGEIPDVGIPMEEMNLLISISSPSEPHNIFNGDNLELIVNNVSKNPISFPLDYGARLFIYADMKWVEIENKQSYPAGIQKDILLYPSKNDPFKKGSFGMVPYQPNLKTSVPLRVILIGNVVQNGKMTEKKAAGYFDLILKPSNTRWK